MALVLGATLFGSLWAIADEGPRWAALAVTIGLAVSLLPILLRVLPPVARNAATNERDPNYVVTVVGGCSCMSSSSQAFSCCSTSANGGVRSRRAPAAGARA
jgi:hypothetical protein